MSDTGDSSRLSTPSSSSPSSSSSAVTPQTSSAGSAQIQVYARIRPSKSLSPSHLSFDPYSSSVTLTLPPASTSAPVQHADQFTRDYINNQRLSYPFSFHGLFPPSASQEAVFNAVGRQCVSSLLEGYHSCIFAYGQTGSGKTFTITGGADSYDSRGIIPRTLSHLFSSLTPSLQQTVRISYLEIYNECGYDLLDRSASLSSLSQLPKVQMLEDDNRCVHLQGLSEHAVSSVEAALELLFRGDTNRMICETPSNDASSRSHCLFSIVLESREAAGSRVRRSKLHLVDLAGSERVKKTQVTGRLFKEAAFINLSLHYLEQCILALHTRAQSRTGASVHIPYRNSMMTAVLRDSLGGNSRTFMIATLSGEAQHVDESISTARFAARVGQIVNRVWQEEAEEDTDVIIRRLKAEVRELKDEVRRLRGEEGVGRGETLGEEERERCVEALKRWLQQEDRPAGSEDDDDEEDERRLRVGNEEKVRLYLRTLKAMIRDAEGKATQGGAGAGAAMTAQEAQTREAELQRMAAVLEEKDAEIARLSSALDAGRSMQIVHRPSAAVPEQSRLSSPAFAPSGSAAQQAARPSSPAPPTPSSSFDAFRQSYATNAALEEKKEHLRSLILEAKSLGESINGSRASIARFKQILQARRVQRELRREESKQQQPQQQDGAVDAEEEAEERRLSSGMEEEKRLYRERFDALKARKEEIEHLKAGIERSRRRMQADYERWKGEQDRQQPETEGDRQPMQEEKEQPQLSLPPAAPRPAAPPRPAAAVADSFLQAGSLSRLMLANGAAGHAPSSSSTVTGSSSSKAVRLVSTGNAQADADIEKFYALRDKLLQQAAAIQGAVSSIK